MNNNPSETFRRMARIVLSTIRALGSLDRRTVRRRSRATQPPQLQCSVLPLDRDCLSALGFSVIKRRVKQFPFSPVGIKTRHQTPAALLLLQQCASLPVFRQPPNLEVFFYTRLQTLEH